VSLLAGTVGGAWLAANSSELLAAATRASRLDTDQLQSFRVLTAEEAREIEAATALIVPSDDTPGAREARVVHFVDQSLATFAKDQKVGMQSAVAELRKRARRKGASSFAALGEADQIRILEDMEKNAADQFNTLWSVTLVGMLANPSYGGNFAKAGWKWIGFSDQFSWAAPYGWYDRNDK
jgi:hypothetical protein